MSLLPCAAANNTVLFAPWTPLPQWPCAGRETLYAAGYLGLCPILYDKLKDSQQLKVM
jgi:hypothetical protein